MRKFNGKFFLACGLLLTLAAFPVLAQEEKVEINKMPFNDFARIVKQQVDAGEVDLTKSFSVELEGVLNKDGKLDLKKSKFTKSEGDAAMIEVGKSFIESINNSGLFTYVKNLGVEKIKFTLAQDDNQTYSAIASEQETSSRAKTISSSMNMLVRMVALMDRDGKKKLGEDERILFNGVTVTSEGKTVTVRFAYEKSVIQEMINRRLKGSETEQSSE